MINVEILKNVDGFVRKFIVNGHSDYAVYGSDIVCSAVSALTQTAVMGLQDIAGISVNYSIEEGFLNCEIPIIHERDKLLKTNAILDTMILGLTNIEKNYSSYIYIVIKEEV